MPLLRIEYTSVQLRSQIYIDVVNWMLLFAVLLVIAIFKNSNNLTHAYGLAVCGTMTITGIMILWILVLRGEMVKTLIAGVVLFITSVFLLSNFSKIPYGGYWSLVIAAFWELF
jgi:KUP system potassium uptake protein